MHAHYICNFICGKAITVCEPHKCASSENREWNHPCTIAAHHLMRSRPPDLAYACCEYLRQAVKELLTAFLICADRMTGYQGVEGSHLKCDQEQPQLPRCPHALATNTCRRVTCLNLKTLPNISSAATTSNSANSPHN
jgi:hypothetical protein